MIFYTIHGISVGADLSRPPPIHRLYKFPDDTINNLVHSTFIHLPPYKVYKLFTHEGKVFPLTVNDQHVKLFRENSSV